MSDLVTGDAVVLGLRPARLPSRALAIVLDLLVLFVGYLLLSLVVVDVLLSLGEAAAAAVSVATLVLIFVGVPVAVETLSRGRSLGKVVCGLRVVREDGGPIRFRHAFVRGLVGVVELLVTLGSVAVLASLVSSRGRRLGDVFAGTLVVRERIPTTEGALLPPPPPPLAAHFAALDLSQVPDRLWLATRQLLTRGRQMDAAAAWSLAARLAGELAERTGAPAPTGLAPADYAAMVVGERQRRDALRIFGPAASPQVAHRQAPPPQAPQAPGPAGGGAFTPPA